MLAREAPSFSPVVLEDGDALLGKQEIRAPFF
jgi:hypothetical protein